MVDYYALISPTIEPLAAASPEERKLVYERLVAMLDQQLRAADPPRSDKDILKERIQMETAIRRVERHILAKRAPAPSKSDQPRQDWERAGSQSLDEAQRDSLSGETSALEPVIAEPVIAEPVIAEPVVADPVIAEAPAPAVPEPFNEQTDENTSFEAPSLAESDHQDTVPGMPKISEPMLVKDDQEAEGFHDQPHERETAQAPDAIDGEGPVAHAAHADAEDEDHPLSPPTIAIKKSIFEERARPAEPSAGPRDFFSRRLPVAADDPLTTITEPERDAESPSLPAVSLDEGSVASDDGGTPVSDDAVRHGSRLAQTVAIAPVPSLSTEIAADAPAPIPEEPRAFTPAPNVILTRDRIISDQRKGLMLRLSILILVLMALGAAVAAVSEFLARKANDAGTTKSSDVSLSSAAPEAKFTDRLPVEPDEPIKTADGAGGGTNASTTTTSDNAPLIQRVALIEEPAGGIGEAKRTEGRVTWKLETLKSGTSGTADLGVKATIDLADAGLSASFVFRKNRDVTSANAYLIEVSFQPAPDNVNGKIRDISMPELRVDERTRGVSLAGIPVPVSDNVFLIGLNALPADMQRNIDLLRTRNWFLWPLRYSTGKRALLLFEKGKPGERIFEDAIQAWK